MKPIYSIPDNHFLGYRARFLGPKGFTLPFQIRYPAYALGLANVSAVMILDIVTGIIPHHLSIASWSISFSVIWTAVVMRFVSEEMPMREVFKIIKNEFKLPRPETAFPETKKLRHKLAHPIVAIFLLVCLIVGWVSFTQMLGIAILTFARARRLPKPHLRIRMSARHIQFRKVSMQ